MDQFENKEDYLLSLYEVCEILGKSSRTITRYVHKRVLHPRGIKSRQGTLEYRFSRSEVDALKRREDSLRQYNYMGHDSLSQAPVASFASVNYPPPAVERQEPFIIPGISFRDGGGAPPAARPSEPSPAYVPFIPPQGNPEKNDKAETANNAKSGNNYIFPAADIPAQYHNNDEIITLLKETTGMLRDQLKAKDDQIKNLDDKIGQLIERNRETNILLKGLQDKMGLLEKPKNNDRARNDRAERGSKIQISAVQEKPQNSAALSEETIISDQIKEKEIVSTAEPNSTDMQARVIPEPARPIIYSAPPVAERSEKNDLPQKKGLFGKIFR